MIEIGLCGLFGWVIILLGVWFNNGGAEWLNKVLNRK